MLNPNFIFSHEFPYIGGTTIHGAIGVRDYNLHYEEARRCYLKEAQYLQTRLELTDEQMINRTEHRLGATYRGLDTVENLLKGYAKRGIYHPLQDTFGIELKTEVLEEPEEKPVNECYN